jgi:hypothetical protein
LARSESAPYHFIRGWRASILGWKGFIRVGEVLIQNDKATLKGLNSGLLLFIPSV